MVCCEGACENGRVCACLRGRRARKGQVCACGGVRERGRLFIGYFYANHCDALLYFFAAAARFRSSCFLHPPAFCAAISICCNSMPLMPLPFRLSKQWRTNEIEIF